MYINDVLAQTGAPTNAVIDFAGYTPEIAGPRTGYYNGRLSNVYLDYTYRDLSITANRRLFITADLKPAAGQAALNPILYLPMSNPTTVGTNAGTGGNFTLTGTIARSGRGPNQYNAPYSDLDGTADYLSRTTALTGIADSKTFTIQFVLNTDVLSAYSQVIGFYEGGTAKVSFQLDTTGIFYLVARNAAGTVIFNAVSAAVITPNRNYVFTLSVDLSNTANRHFYLNGQAVALTWNTYTNDFINFAISASPSYRIGASNAPANYVNGRLGALWFNTSYINLSVASNLAKFVSGTGIDAKPVDLGATGELPTGTAPLIYLPMYGNNAGKNYGTGGDFTVNSGPYTGARGPNEYWASAVGSSGYLYRDTPLSGATDTKTLTFFMLFKPASTTQQRMIWQIDGTAGGALRGQIQVTTLNNFRVTFYNSAGTNVLDATVSSPVLNSTTTTYAIHFCADLSNSAKRAIYINGTSATVTWATYTNDTINFSAQRSAIGADWGASWNGSILRGSLGSLYVTNTYVDFTQESNRLLFADCFNYSTDIGSAITALTVPNPLVFMKFDPANNGANFGTGGNYTNSSMSDGGQL
jgi:hypothetical protein